MLFLRTKMSIFMSFNSLNASYLPNIVKCLQTITMILEWAFPEPKIHCRSRRTIIQLRFHCWAFHEILLPIINVIVQFVSSIYWAILSSDFLATSIIVFWKSCECLRALREFQIRLNLLYKIISVKSEESFKISSVGHEAIAFSSFA